MTTVAAGTNIQITLPAGDTLTLSGVGTAQVVPPGASGMPYHPLRTVNAQPISFGPYAVQVYINLTSDPVTPLVYTISLPASQANYTNVYSLASGAKLGRGFAWLTDSRGQQTYDQTASAITGRPRAFTVMNALAGQPFDIINNAGVNGDTISGAAARLMNSNLGVGFGYIGDASTNWSNIPPASQPGINIPAITDVAVCLGVNDIMGAGTPAVTAYANITQNVFAPILALGKRLYVCTVMQANSASPGYLASNAIQLSLFNSMLRAYVQANTGVFLFDFEKATLSGTSTVLETAATDLRDGALHENNSGGYKQGRVAAAVVQLLYPPRVGILPASNAETYNVSNTLPFLTRNPLLVGSTAITSTGFSGSCAGSAVAGSPVLNNLNFVRTGTGSCVLSAVARTDNTGGNNTKMVMTWGAANDTMEHRGNSVHADVVVGGQYEGRTEVTFTGPSGAPLAAADNLKGVQAYVQYNDGTNNFFSYEMAVTTATDVALVGSQNAAIYRTRPLTIPSSGTPTILRLNIGAVSAGATGSPEVTFGKPVVARVA